MREVQPRLGQRDSGEETQSLQRQIVSDLAKLIEQAKKSGSQRQEFQRPQADGQAQRKPAQTRTAPGNSPAPAQESNPNSP